MRLEKLESLDDADVKVMKVILEEGITRGSVAMKRAELDGGKMVTAVRKLLRAELINAEGELDDPRLIAFSTLSARPSQLSRIRRRLLDIAE